MATAGFGLRLSEEALVPCICMADIPRGHRILDPVGFGRQGRLA